LSYFSSYLIHQSALWQFRILFIINVVNYL
jgi:hypothetical protein